MVAHNHKLIHLEKLSHITMEDLDNFTGQIIMDFVWNIHESAITKTQASHLGF